ncbi:hypothetical protein JCM3765_005329 [Sporobolomyces pararoseus]
MVDYRGAVVEDLQLSPALVLPTSTSVGTALQLAYERDFSILPLSDPSTRQLLGWISIDEVKALAKEGSLDLDSPLSQLNDKTDKSPKSPVRHFTKARAYTVITPDTSLEQLEKFFSEQDQLPCGVRFALVTDAARKFTLGVVTADDLEKFTERRFPNARSSSSAASPSTPSTTTTTNLPPAVPLA